MLLEWGQLIIIALATAACTVTLSRAKIFAPLRVWLADHWPWAGRLIACTYCTSHWVAAFLLVMFIQPGELFPAIAERGHVAVSFGLDWLAVVAISAPITGLVMLGHKLAAGADGQR